jgi:hypothetical protein
MKSLVKLPIYLTVVVSLASALTPTAADAAVAYVRSMVGAPWGVSTNETAMSAVFGAGASDWFDLRYESVIAADLFNSTYSFVYMEGGDRNADELELFFSTHQTLVQNWVANGGNLLINAAPNEGNGMSFGFGGVNLNYPQFSGSATAVDPLHPIFAAGSYGTPGTSFIGYSFSHASVTGPLTPIITGESGTILGEADFGNGHVLFGGMTTNNFQYPTENSAALRANIIDYAANYSVNAVPEPGHTLALGLLLGAGFTVRRRLAR